MFSFACNRNSSLSSCTASNISDSISSLIRRSFFNRICTPNNSLDGENLVLLLTVEFKYCCATSRCLNHSSGLGAANLVSNGSIYPLGLSVRTRYACSDENMLDALPPTIFFKVIRGKRGTSVRNYFPRVTKHCRLCFKSRNYLGRTRTFRSIKPYKFAKRIHYDENMLLIFPCGWERSQMIYMIAV